MQVVMVTPCYYPVKGGTETIVRNLVMALNKNNIKADVMSFNVDQTRNPKWQRKTETIDGITVYRIPALDWVHSYRITSGVNFIPGRFTNILKNYDIIHFHEFELSFPFFSFAVKRPKIIHLHGVDCNFLRKNHISRFLLKHLVQTYISISNRMTKDLVELGIPKSQIVYIPNGIDTNFFAPTKRKEENLLLFVGRISQGKGLHILIKSLQYLKSNVRLTIIGPPDWDSTYYQNIMDLIKKENMRGQHEIMYFGAMNQSKLLEWYQKATIFILPSFYEGFPVTVLEALSCETPVIATPVGGIPEVIKNYKTGILIPPGDCKSLANALQYLLENENVRLKIALEGRKQVTQRYSLNIAVKRLCMVYKQLTEKAGSK
jgi:glycosyltransferase involved in cell wall biosynthesis